MARMTFIVELMVDTRLPEAERAIEARGRLMRMSGVTSVEVLPQLHLDPDQIKDATEGRR